MKDDKGLVVAFSKRIFQSAVPVAMTLIYSVKKHEEHLLISDTDMKFKLFDKNTFEILYTFLGPLYDSYVMQFVSRFELFCFYSNCHFCCAILFPTKHVGNVFILTLGFYFLGRQYISWTYSLFKILYIFNQQKHLFVRNASGWQSISITGYCWSLFGYNINENRFYPPNTLHHW